MNPTTTTDSVVYDTKRYGTSKFAILNPQSPFLLPPDKIFPPAHSPFMVKS